MSDPKPKKPGPEAERLKINAPWQDAVKQALPAKPPARENKRKGPLPKVS